MRCCLGVDPSSGLSSPMGVVIVSENKGKYKLIYNTQFDGLVKEASLNSSFFADQVGLLLKYSLKLYPDLIFASEEPRMFGMGKANTIMERVLGRLEYVIEGVHNIPIVWINPTSLKKKITGSGKADKIEVANSILEYKWDFKAKQSSLIKIKELIDREKFDQTDAIAVALCGLKNKEKEENLS